MMLRSLLKLFLMLSIVLSIVCLADRYNFTELVWEKTLPVTILPRKLSPSEVALLEIDSQKTAANKRVSEIEQQMRNVEVKRSQMLASLSKQCGMKKINYETDVTEIMKDSLIAATIRSIAASDDNLSQLGKELRIQEKALRQFEARKVAIQNGVSPETLQTNVTPSERIRLNEDVADYSRKKHYEEIFHEALKNKQLNTRGR